jgi:Trypsin-like peptidase domain
MSGSITIHPYSLSTLRLSSKRDTVTRSATGFILKRGSQFYLVTALHVLTGRNWQTKKPLSDTGFIPEQFSIMVPFYKRLSSSEHRLNWAGYAIVPNGPDEEVAPWLVHPKYREDVDVGIVPLSDLPNRFLKEQISAGIADPDSKIFAFDWEAEPKLLTRVGDDVFVVGFPENIRVSGEFPIWKRGSVASEPDIGVQGLPYLLVDTGTRAGMSGSPVIRRSPSGIAPLGQAFVEPWTDLFGVYSGRFGADDLTSQLGIVWPRQVLSDILNQPTLGKSSLCTRLWL